MGVVAILVMWPRCSEQTFVLIEPMEVPHIIWLRMSKRYWRCLNIVDGQTDDRRKKEHVYTISSPGESAAKVS